MRWYRRSSGLLLAGIGLILPLLVSRAQDTARVRGAIQLRLDNDLIAVRGAGPPPDYDYTHGTRLTVTVPNGRRLVALGLAQEIYTPRHNTVEVVRGDRPYGAWLYSAVSVMQLAPVRLDSIDVRLGVTGAPALGEQVQNGVHRLLGNRLEEGWGHQLPTMLAATLSCDARRLLATSSTAQPSRFLTLDGGGTVGTVRRELHVGVETYASFGSVGGRSAAVPLARRPGRWHFMAGFHESYVQHDAFIEGAAHVPGAARLPWVAETFAGAGARFGRWSAEYRSVVRGREYRAEPDAHAYGSIVLGLTRCVIP